MTQADDIVVCFDGHATHNNTNQGTAARNQFLATFVSIDRGISFTIQLSGYVAYQSVRLRSSFSLVLTPRGPVRYTVVITYNRKKLKTGDLGY